MMHNQELTIDSLDSATQSLDVRQELIQQIEAEFSEDVQTLKPRIQELLESFILNGGHYWSETNPLLYRIINELEAGAAISEEESSSNEENEIEEYENELTIDEGEHGNDDDDDLSERLEIITDDEREEGEHEQEDKEQENSNTLEISEINGRHQEDLNDADDNGLNKTDSRNQLTDFSENTIPATVVIGPNGTEVDGFGFNNIVWSTTATATRSLLSLIFSDDVLATHTLTGKPSPAFHGRERPPKMQLDPLKTSDIIHCVVSRCKNANERQVRSSITSKCADTAKKYKRRSSKGSHE